MIVLPLMAFAQENSKQTKAQKKADKNKEKREADNRKAELAGKKFHYKIQDKATRKRMKKHRRRVDHGYPSGRPGFFKRIFGSNQSSSLNNFCFVERGNEVVFEKNHSYYCIETKNTVDNLCKTALLQV